MLGYQQLTFTYLSTQEGCIRRSSIISKAHLYLKIKVGFRSLFHIPTLQHIQQLKRL